MDFVESMLVWVKDINTQNFIDKDSATVAWLFYTFYSVLLIIIATIMTTWWGSGAAGSGVASSSSAAPMDPPPRMGQQPMPRR